MTVTIVDAGRLWGLPMIESVRPEVLADAAARQALADTVSALRDELAGLRTSAQLRAVIEQAKGVLVERHHITLDEAFDRLREMSQQHNVRLVEVAATLVGVAIPTPDDDEPAVPVEVVRDRVPVSRAPSDAWTTLQSQPQVRAGMVDALLDTVAGATKEGEEAAGLVAELLAAHDVAAVTLYRAATDGSLRLLGAHGIPWDEISPWRSIPPSRDIPYVRTVLEDEVLAWGDRAERAKQFPSVRPTSRFEAAMTVPVRDGDAVVGVAGLLWHDRQELPPDRVAAIARLVRRVTPILLRNTAAVDPEAVWLDTLMSLHLDPWMQLESVPGQDGAVRDFVILDAAPSIPGSSAWPGRRLLEAWPHSASDGLVQGLVDLVRAGGAWSMTVTEQSSAPWGSPGTRVRAVRLARRVVLVWGPAGPLA